MNSRYMIVETLRQSPGTQVFLAMDTWKRCKVILKLVRPDAHPAWRMQFRTEVQILQRLDCEWIPSLIESADGIRGSWLCEEYIEGQTLDLWLASRPSRKQKRDVFEQILQLIAGLHQIGYLYMDLKPDNVLIRNDHACLIDFNACLPIGSTRPVLVSRDSLPPEGLAGKTMDERADQIGLGKLWLRMAGPSQAAWTALSKNPDRRFRSLEQFGQAICRPRRYPAVLVAVLALSAGAAALSGPLVHPSQAAAEAAVPAAGPLPKAADLCESLVRRSADQPVALSEWLTAARSALQQKHVALAGWLCDHPPASPGIQSRYFQFLLALMLGMDSPTEELEQILEELPGQLGWTDELPQLFKELIRRKIVLEPDLIRSLLHSLSEEEALRSDCLECLMNYLLLISSETGMLFELPDSLAGQLESRAADLYSLYQRASWADGQDSSQTAAFQPQP